MVKDNRNPKTRKISGQFRPISIHINASSKRLRQKRGFVDQTLLAKWDDIIGAELAAICQPKEIKTRRGQGAILVIECLSAYSSELQMRADEICMRINSSLGKNQIAKIVLSQQHLGFQNRPLRQNISNPSNHEKTTIKARPVPSSLSQILANTKDDDLRTALKNISDSFYKKGQ